MIDQVHLMIDQVHRMIDQVAVVIVAINLVILLVIVHRIIPKMYATTAINQVI